MHRIGFCGAGQMATALAAGFVSAGSATEESIVAYDPSEAARSSFAAALPASTLLGRPTELADCDTVFLAVKPQYIETALAPLAGNLSSRHLVVSIIAGATLGRLTGLLSGGCRLIRVMPNTPCLVRMGACGISPAASATDADVAHVVELFQSVGVAHVVAEGLLDAVTGLSGSGPAYIYQVIEALSDGGVLMGLPRHVATDLAAQTVKGAAEMVRVTGLHPGELKDRVASPAGTTIAGLEALENHGIRAGFIQAVRAATDRSVALQGDPPPERP